LSLKILSVEGHLTVMRSRMIRPSHAHLARAFTLIAAAIVSLSMVLPGPACAQAARTAITVSTTTPADTLPFFWAVKQGMFDKAGLDITVVASPGGAASIVAVVGGAAQVGYSNALSISAAHQKGIPLSYIAPGGEYNSNAPYAKILVLPDATIKSAKDLEGKTVAVTGLHDLLALSTEAWLDKQGADRTKVHFIELPPGSMLAALQQKRVDAMAIFDPYVSAAEAAGARDLGHPYDAVSSRFMTAGWFVSETWAKDHRDAAIRFAQVINAAQEYTNAHYDELIPFIAEYSKQSADTLAKLPRVRVPNTLSPTLIQPLIDAAVREKELAAPMKATDIIFAGVP
jgi:NitT/TauT family transport system substrate-binding protein